MKPAARFELADVGVVFSAEAQQRAREFLDSAAAREEAEVLFTGWGSPRLDAGMLRRLPKLRAVFHAAGSVRGIASAALWERGIAVCSAWRVNARPVAEFTLAQIIFALKHAPFRSRQMHAERRKPVGFVSPGAAGAAVVGLVGLGAIGRQVLRLLECLEVKVVAHDPFLAADEARQLGVELVGLAELFRTSDVVSLHLPEVEGTRRMIGSNLLEAMKPGATLINTSRGSVVDEAALVEICRRRGDIFAMLDVAEPDPPAPDSALYDLPNVWLTPHIAGSVGLECHRMGDAMIEDARRFVAGEPLVHQLTQAQAEGMT